MTSAARSSPYVTNQDSDTDTAQVCSRIHNTTTIPLLCHLAGLQQHDQGHSNPSPEGQLLLSRRRRRGERGRRRGPVQPVESKGGGGRIRCQGRRGNHDASPPRP